jgi:hypothetical protein
MKTTVGSTSTLPEGFTNRHSENLSGGGYRVEVHDA